MKCLNELKVFLSIVTTPMTLVVFKRYCMNTIIFSLNRRKAAQLMNENHALDSYKKKFKAITNSMHKKPVYENKLVQKFEVEKINPG